MLEYLIYKKIKEYSKSISYSRHRIIFYFVEIKPVSIRFNLFIFYASGYKL